MGEEVLIILLLYCLINLIGHYEFSHNHSYRMVILFPSDDS